jgi:pimeloyl-ACP methyl ester carboxylesterase
VEGNLIGEDCGLISREVARMPYDRFEKELFAFIKTRLPAGSRPYFALDRASPLAFYRSSVSLVAWSDSGQLLKRFKSLTCGKAYLYGERSAMRATLEKLGSVKKIKIPGCGHFPMHENPERFYSELYEFVTA